MSEATKREAAYKTLVFLYPSPPLKVTRMQITPHAAAFAFRALVKVDRGSRMSAGLFKLWSPMPITSWKDLSLALAKAVLEAIKDPEKYKKNLLGVRGVLSGHRRMLQLHLDNPEIFPCPEYALK